MKRIRNQKGFTLVELLVAVAILGIITGMSIPLIRNVRLNNEQRKYNSYGDSLISATKLYVDSYGQDLFGYKKTGCALVSYQQLKDKGLIKDFSDKNMSCNSEDTLVRVVKMNKQYGYSYQLYCGVEGADGKAISPEFKSSSTSKKVSEVIKKQNDDSDKDDDNDGFSDAACNIISSMDVRIIPASGTTKAASYSPKVTLMSSTGINPGSSVQYAWVDVDSKDTIPAIDYNAITDWKTADFTVDSKNSQMQKILSITDNIVLSKPKTLKTPSDAPAYYALVLKIDNFRDLEGEYWKDKDDPENQYKTSGIFNIGKKYTLTYDNNGGSGCSNVSVLKEKNVDTKWGDDTNTDLCKPTRINYTFTGWNTSPDGSGETITKNTVIESDLTVYAQWRLNRVHFRYKIQSGETLTAQTTADNGTVYNWTKNGDNYVMQSINNATAKIYDQSVERGTNKTINFANYNNSKFLKIEKTGYHALTDKEWICVSGCKTAGQTFDHDPTITIANTDDICDSKNGDCTVTLKVNWTPTIYTITLDKNNGTGGTDTIYEKYNIGWYSTAAATGTPINSITSPTRTGYTFAGYYTAASGGTQIIKADGTIVSGKTTQFSAVGTLYAHWTAKTATITFNCNGGTVTGGGTATTATQTFTYDGGTQNFSKSCTRTGYTQLGWAATSTATAKDWNTNSGVINSWINSHSPTATIYAVWRKNHVIIKLNSNGGTLASTHNSAYTLNGNSILLDGKDEIQYVDYGTSIGTNGLLNWNNPSYLNLVKGTSFATLGKEWNTKADGSGTSYNQDTNYQASNFCDAANNDCIVTLYLDWSTVSRMSMGIGIAESEYPWYICPVDWSMSYSNCTWANGEIENVHMTIHNVTFSEGGIANIDVGLYANSWKGNSTAATGTWGKICLQKGDGAKGNDSCDYQLTDKVYLPYWMITGKTVHRETFKVPLTKLSAGSWRVVVPREANVETNWYHSFTNSNANNHNNFIFTITE